MKPKKRELEAQVPSDNPWACRNNLVPKFVNRTALASGVIFGEQAVAHVLINAAALVRN